MRLFVVEARQQQGYVALLAAEHPVAKMPNQNLASEVDLASLREVVATDLAVELLVAVATDLAVELLVAVVMD